LASRSPPTSRKGHASSQNRFPSISVDPEVGASKPMIMRIVVDLPDPLGPRNPVTAPGRTSKVRSLTAVAVPYRLVNECAVIMIEIVERRAADVNTASGWTQVGLARVRRVGISPPKPGYLETRHGVGWVRGNDERAFYRNNLKNVRTSETNSSGRSSAAKWPPDSSSVQCTML
jgi:hypothetical protein